jgi:protein SCO1/2
MIMKKLLTLATALLALAAPAAAHEGHHQEAAPAPAVKRAPWGAAHFPNVPLVTHEGKTMRFYDDLLKDKKVLVNFIYALCDQACPLDTAKLAQVQKLLGARVGRDIFIYSITLDPEHDSPEALKAYAEKFGAGPGWLFLTGSREDIDRLRMKFGERGAKEEHANSVRVGDVARGQWIRVPLAADAAYIVAEARNTLEPGWSAGKELKSIAEAPRAEIRGPGQLLFRNRCAACHTLGQGAHLGPDLKGVVQRRSRAWLLRYIGAPDKMRAAKDPIALELARNSKVLMPNLRLTHKELAEILDYLEARSAL